MFCTSFKASFERAALGRIGGLVLALSVLLLMPMDVSPEFDSSSDWPNGKHDLKVCLEGEGCPEGMADSVKAAIEIWDEEGLTWKFAWTDSCDSADITIRCKAWDGPEGGICTRNVHRWWGVGTIRSAEIDMNTNVDWGFCDDKHELVRAIAHELGHCARLSDVPVTDPARLMNEKHTKPGHSRGLTPADSIEGVTSDTADVSVGCYSTPQGGARQTEYVGVITAADGTPPLNLDEATAIFLEGFPPDLLEVVGYLPLDDEHLQWSAFPNTDVAHMALFYLTIEYPESTVTREGILYVTDFPWEPGWEPEAVAPGDTVVPSDTSWVILDYTASQHPAGDVTSFLWVIDDSLVVEGGPVCHVNLAAGEHLVELVGRDQFGFMDVDTMFVFVEGGTGVDEIDLRYDRAEIWLDFPVPFALGGALPISYGLPHVANVRLAIYDVTGRRVVTLADNVIPGGPRQVEWDLKDAGGKPVAPGVYFCTLRVGKSSTTRKIVLVE